MLSSVIMGSRNWRNVVLIVHNRENGMNMTSALVRKWGSF